QVAAPGVLGNDSDVDGDALRAALVSGPAHGALTLNADGSFTYTPAAGFRGTDSFTYRASDGSAEDLATVTITDDDLPPPRVPAAHPLAVSGAPNGSATLYAPDVAGLYDPTRTATLSPFGGVGVGLRTAVADVDGDGIRDTVCVTGPGTPIRFAVVSGKDNSTVLVAPTAPFAGSESFTGGGVVAGAGIDRGGRSQIVVTPGPGGGARGAVLSLLPAGAGG